MASPHTGYQIPVDVNKLLNFLKPDSEKGLPTEELVFKQKKFFLNRMETTFIRLAAVSHPECYKDSCNKVCTETRCHSQLSWTVVITQTVFASPAH